MSERLPDDAASVTTGAQAVMSPDASPETGGSQRGAGWRRLRWLAGAFAWLMGALCLVAAAVWGGLHTEWATQRLLGALTGVGVRVAAAQGALLGDFRAERVEVDLPRGGALILDEPAWQGLTLLPDMEVAWWLGVRAQGLQARRVRLDWVAGPSSPEPLAAPRDLSLPVSVHLDRVQVGEFVSNLVGDLPFKGVDATLALHDGLLPTRHSLRLRHLSWGDWQVQGQASVAVRGRMKVDAALQAVGAVSADLRAQAKLRVSGALTDMGVTAQAHVQRGKQPAQSLSADAQVQAFAPWPVSRLKARFEGVNLADLHPKMPRTDLHGAVDMAPQRKGHADLHGRVDLQNRLSGAWDQGRLPVRSWQGTWQLARAKEARSVDAILASVQLDWQLALPRVRSGDTAQVTLKGGWGQGRSLRLSMAQLEPQALHGQAPALRLQGEISVSPETKSTGQKTGWRDTAATLLARIQGEYGAAYAQPERACTMAAGQRPVEASLEARYAPGLVSVSRLLLASAGASAELRDARWQWPIAPDATTTPPPAVAWRTKGRLEVRDFDPQLWLPWPAEVSGRNALSAQASFELDATWRGQLDAQLAPSWLAGVPLKGAVQWQSPSQKQVMGLNVNLDAAGNLAQFRAQLPWQADAAGRPQLGASAQWQAQVNASALQALQPLVALAGARQITGDVSLSAQGQGLWPRLSSEGQARVTGLRWLPKDGEGVSVTSAQAQWGVDARNPASAVKAQLDVQQVRAANVELSHASVRIGGSVQAHEAHVNASLTRQTPSTASQSGGEVESAKAPAERLTADLTLQGGLRWGDSAHDWQGRIQDLVVRLGDAPGREALRLQPTPVTWQQRDRSESVTLGATQLNVMGAVLHLREAGWSWADRQRDPVGVAKLDLSLEAFNLPELLTRWQPKAGWGGDLILEGGLKLTHQRSAPWSVDATVQRKSGDISLFEPTIEGNSAQRLGIRDARVTLQARQGTWTLTQAFEGRALGKLTGRQVVQAADPMVGPQGTDALQGDLDLSIGNLRPWGTWIPAGWRISGQVQAKAALAGTLGAPRYSGQVQGENLGAGQALMGVNLSDGKLRMSLMGDLMVLEHFEARGGSAGGLLTAQGQATFGDVVQARVSLTADRFPLLQRVDRRVVLSGVVNGALGTETMEADGRVRVDEGLIDISKSSAPTVGDDVMVVNRPAHARPMSETNGNGATGPRQREPQRKLMANLDVDLGKSLRIKGMGLDSLLTGVVKVTTPSNRPTLNGTIRVENGTYAAYGQKLVVERGTVAFTGPIENPRLDILAMRAQSPTAASSDVKVGVAITGTAQDPRIRLYSEPAMSETEKLSWLVLGRAPTGLGGADIGLLQTAAVALLSGEGSSPSDNLIGMLGLDEFSVRQTDGAVRETVVNVGKQVSRYWYVGYERNLNATGGNWQLIYTLARRFTLRLQAGVDNAADLIWSWRWD
ncbi:MAG: hypothetical protein E6Q31_01295 [Aquabacterium sp.]|nr:MAG: hypothetical protein E6Q31_01295 [Aquabacterium sp.]